MSGVNDINNHSSVGESLGHSFYSARFTAASLPRIDILHLDQWLEEVLQIEIPRSLGDDSTCQDDGAAVLLFAHRVAIVSKLFLELGRLPMFDEPTILSVKQKSGSGDQFIARIAIPTLEHISHVTYQHVVQFAAETCHWISQTEFSASAKTRLFEAIDKKIINALQKTVPAGKSTIPVLRTAHSMSIPYIHLGLGVYQLGWGSKARRMDRSTTDLDTSIGSKLSQNKVVSAALLRMAGLPSPVHAVASKQADALSAAHMIGFPVVVKPTDKDRGEGVTVDILHEAALKDAFEAAQQLAQNKQVIIERQVDGVCHRVFIANGRLLYAVKRLPMSIKGDGIHTVTQLVDAEVKLQNNLPPWNRTEIRPIDAMAIAAMEREGFSPDSVPPDGTLVPLRRIESTEWGGIDEDMSDKVHPENLSIAIRAAELFGLHVAGIDIITKDISTPWFENGAIVNEVNFAPLFGGGEISRRHIPLFLNELIQGDGKIPIEVFAGENSVRLAAQKHAEFLQRGLRCFITSSSQTLDPHKRRLAMPLRRLEDRVKALLCRPDVDALIVVKRQTNHQKP